MAHWEPLLTEEEGKGPPSRFMLDNSVDAWILVLRCAIAIRRSLSELQQLRKYLTHSV
jgi:hypothetical protein